MVSSMDETVGTEGTSDEVHGERAKYGEDTDSFMLRTREFRFKGLPSVLIMKQDFVTVEGTGGAVWRPSIAFASAMCDPDGPRLLPFEGKSVLEISSGLGLGSIVAWHLGASKVIATDVNSENGPMSLLRQNVTANCCYSDRTATTVSSTTGDNHARRPPPRVRELRWGDEAQLVDVLSEFGGVGPDVILACDVLYDDTLLPALAETLLGACAHTSGGMRPNLCIAHQWRYRKREALFFEELKRRFGAGDGDTGGNEWREVYRHADISVFLMQWAR